MITLRLFRTADPFVQLEERPLAHGEICVGRDPSADWTISDARGDLSRRHCTIGVDDERVWLRDTSSNGVFVGFDRLRAPRTQALDLRPGEALYMGEYMIVLDGRMQDQGVAVQQQPSSAPGSPTPDEARQPGSAPLAPTDAGMLEAFCAGAGLEPSTFAGEDPAALMQHLGRIYRVAVDELCELMSERALLKASLQLDRTTISAHDNNPLKWAPSHQVAIDLLREGETGFLKGAAAFEASFADLRRHGACLLAASRGAMKAVLEELKPEQLEAAVPRQSLGFLSRNETSWRQLQLRHAQLTAEASAEAGGRLERAFSESYEARRRAFDIEGEAA